ncbi:MAG: 3-keto-5-aminohexanoate cleavage protein [Thermodesulfobacteriota bacterium]|nr:3-keto-5-aminohexanoate cleavage protein [Thermodesulfobacteriota bacterium]
MSSMEDTGKKLLDDVFGKEGRKKFIPLIEEPKDSTWDRKLVINVATTGAFLTREQNPNQALNPQAIADAVIESHKAGAAIWHVHTRDDNGFPSVEPEVTIRTEEMVFKECPDIITSCSVWGAIGKQGADLIKPMVDPLLKANSKYLQTAVIPAVTMVVGPVINHINKENLVGMVEYLQERGVKPEFQAFTLEGIENVRKWLIEPGILEAPYFINVITGTHASVFYEAPTTPYNWGIVYLMTMLEKLPPDTFKGATIGGRNWLPMVMAALLLGVDCVRIGMEDALYMYPHKDELIKKSCDVVKKVATIANEMGRGVATSKEAKKILGLS